MAALSPWITSYCRQDKSEERNKEETAAAEASGIFLSTQAEFAYISLARILS